LILSQFLVSGCYESESNGNHRSAKRKFDTLLYAAVGTASHKQEIPLLFIVAGAACG
jgi:hypothetical protein